MLHLGGLPPCRETTPRGIEIARHDTEPRKLLVGLFHGNEVVGPISFYGVAPRLVVRVVPFECHRGGEDRLGLRVLLVSAVGRGAEHGETFPRHAMHRLVPTPRGLLDLGQGRRIPSGLGERLPDLGAGVFCQRGCECTGVRNAWRDRQRRLDRLGGGQCRVLDSRMIANRLRRVVVDQAEKPTKGFLGDFVIAQALEDDVGAGQALQCLEANVPVGIVTEYAGERRLIPVPQIGEGGGPDGRIVRVETRFATEQLA